MTNNGQLTKMIQTIPKQLPDFLATVSPFDQLSEEILVKLSEKLEVEHYSMGRIILRREEMPERVSIVYEGVIRNLGYDPRTQTPVTLELLEPGDIFGWVGLVRGVASETAIASCESTCLCLPVNEFCAYSKNIRRSKVAFKTVVARSKPSIYSGGN